MNNLNADSTHVRLDAPVSANVRKSSRAMARLATSLEACVALVAAYADHPDYREDWTG